MAGKEKTGNLFHRLRYFSWFLVLLWTGCIIASLFWNLHEQREKIRKIAYNSAELSLGKDIIYRRWAARHGGVYVPVSDHTPPNPYLKVPDRDITTPSGLSLTLVNPAYMTRQVNEMMAAIHGSQSHLTSLNPIRPENSPDSWEAAALKSFEKGIKEVSAVEKIAGEEYMRVIRPFVTEKDCLKCHASQGYKVGDIRGGISVSIPMASLWAIEKPLTARISLAHFLLWIVGIAGIGVSKRSLDKEIRARERAEEVLSESANKLRIVADFTYDWEYWRSPDDRFLYVSPSCERITGYERQEFIQDPGLYSRIIHPDDRERVLAHLREDQHHVELCELEFRIIRRDGEERWIGHACKVVVDANGQSLGRRASDRDITERKQAEEALRAAYDRYRSFSAVTEQLGWTTNSEGEVVEDLTEWRSYTGQSFNDIKGWGWSKALHPDDLAHTTEVWKKSLREKSRYETEYRIRRHDGVYRHFMARGVPVFKEGGTIREWVGICIDITERKHAEETLRKAHDELEKRVQERTRELANANQSLRDLSTRLLSAHEDERERIAGDLHDTIGSCLAAIKFKVEEALQDIEKKPSAAAEALNTVIPVVYEGIEECRRIQTDLRPSMLDDLGLLPTLSWLFRRFQTIYSGIRIEQEMKIEEEEIPDAFKIVIFRIGQEALNNIAKHSKADLVHFCLRKMDERIELMVEDNGRGFDLEKVLGSESTKRELGLTSMRERTELSGGSFAIESIEGKGTMIRASWPLS